MCVTDKALQYAVKKFNVNRLQIEKKCLGSLKLQQLVNFNMTDLLCIKLSEQHHLTFFICLSREFHSSTSPASKSFKVKVLFTSCQNPS